MQISTFVLNLRNSILGVSATKQDSLKSCLYFKLFNQIREWTPFLTDKRSYNQRIKSLKTRMKMINARVYKRDHHPVVSTSRHPIPLKLNLDYLVIEPFGDHVHRGCSLIIIIMAPRVLSGESTVMYISYPCLTAFNKC